MLLKNKFILFGIIEGYFKRCDEGEKLQAIFLVIFCDLNFLVRLVTFLHNIAMNFYSIKLLVNGINYYW